METLVWHCHYGVPSQSELTHSTFIPSNALQMNFSFPRILHVCVCVCICICVSACERDFICAKTGLVDDLLNTVSLSLFYVIFLTWLVRVIFSSPSSSAFSFFMLLLDACISNQALLTFHHMKQ